MPRLSVFAIFILLLILLIIITGSVVTIKLKPADLKTEFYIWQRNWTQKVQASVARAAEHANGFMILSGEFDVRKNHMAFSPVHVRWDIFSLSDTVVTLVFRIRTPVSCFLENNGTEQTGAFIEKHLSKIITDVREKGIQVSGVQLDYDCPTSDLSEYGRLLTYLIGLHPDWAWSVTTLPTWLPHEEFEKLVARLDYFVLQTYTFQRPVKLGDDLSVIHTAEIPKYIEQASSAITPFYVALPTYGYAVIFDENGCFTGLEAETASHQWAPAYTVKKVMSQPADIALIVSQLNTDSPKGMLGMAWFRLPVDGDTYNWSWPTLLAVMKGRLPEISYQAELRRVNSGLYEVWVTNPADSGYSGRIKLTIRQTGCHIIAKDMLRDFSEIISENNRVRILSGKIPLPGRQAMAAWYSVHCEKTDHEPFQIFKTEVLQ